MIHTRLPRDVEWWVAKLGKPEVTVLAKITNIIFENNTVQVSVSNGNTPLHLPIDRFLAEYEPASVGHLDKVFEPWPVNQLDGRILG